MNPYLNPNEPHSPNCDNCGCYSRIVNLEKDNTKQDKRMDNIDKRHEVILTRINVILGGVAVACLLLAINLWIGK